MTALLVIACLLIVGAVAGLLIPLLCRGEEKGLQDGTGTLPPDLDFRIYGRLGKLSPPSHRKRGF